MGLNAWGSFSWSSPIATVQPPTAASIDAPAAQSVDPVFANDVTEHTEHTEHGHGVGACGQDDEGMMDICSSEETVNQCCGTENGVVSIIVSDSTESNGDDSSARDDRCDTASSGLDGEGDKTMSMDVVFQLPPPPPAHRRSHSARSNDGGVVVPPVLHFELAPPPAFA